MKAYETIQILVLEKLKKLQYTEKQLKQLKIAFSNANKELRGLMK